MKKQTYTAPIIVCMPVSAVHSLLAGSGDGMPTLVTDTKVTYDGPGGSPFESDEEVAAKVFFNTWETWEE